MEEDGANLPNLTPNHCFTKKMYLTSNDNNNTGKTIIIQ